MAKRRHARGAAKKSKKLKAKQGIREDVDSSDSEEDFGPVDTKCTCNCYRQSKEMIEKTEQEVSKLIKELKLRQSDVEVGHTGNKPSEINTKSTYLKHIRGLRYFCSLIGMLIFLGRVPTRLIKNRVFGIEKCHV